MSSRQLRRWRPSGPGLAESGIYVLAIGLVLGAGVLHAGRELAGRSDDARYYTWLGWRIGRLIAHGHILPFRIPDVIAPFGLDLRLLDGYLPSYVSGLFNVVFGPVLAYNLTFVTGAVLNVVCARSLARRLSPHRVVHVVTAVAFLTAPPIALNVQVGLLPLFWAFTLPLLVADALDVVTGVRDVRLVRLAVLLVLAYLCSVYFLVFGGLGYVLIVGIAAVRRHSWRIPMAAAAAGAIALVALTPFVAARVSFDRDENRRGAPTELLADSELYSADALSIVAQPTRSTLLLPRPAAVDRSLLRLIDPSHTLEWTIMPGLLLLVGGGLFLAKRDRRRLPLALGAAVMWVLALGPSLRFAGHFAWEHSGSPVAWLPYRLLLAVPTLGELRDPYRTSFVLVAVLAAATAIALDRILTARPGTVAVVAVVSGVLLATNLLLPLPTDTLGTTPASEHALRAVARLARPGDTVMSVPADCDPSFESYQVFHRTAVAGCAGSFAANPWSKLLGFTRATAVTKLRCDRTTYGRIETANRSVPTFGADDVAELRERFGVRFLIVDRDALREPNCSKVEDAVAFLQRYRRVGGDQRLEVLDLSSLRDGRRL